MNPSWREGNAAVLGRSERPDPADGWEPEFEDQPLSLSRGGAPVITEGLDARARSTR